MVKNFYNFKMLKILICFIGRNTIACSLYLYCIHSFNNSHHKLQCRQSVYILSHG